jgi:hypothetical protein
MNIQAQSGPLKYEGNHIDAYEFIIQTRRSYEDAGYDMQNMLSDFIFTIEVELQNIGYLTENFDINIDFQDEDTNFFPRNLGKNDSFYYQGELYTVIEIKWNGEIANILVSGNGIHRIECNMSDIS